MNVTTVDFETGHQAAAAELVARRIADLRRLVPELPDTLTSAHAVAMLQTPLLAGPFAVAAVAGGQLVGFLAATMVDGFRGTPRRAALVPVFGHAVDPALDATSEARVYRALYREAARRWGTAGCEVHAIAIPAGQSPTVACFAEAGFGMMLHDGIRPAVPLGAAAPQLAVVRRATTADAPALARLDAEHNAYYSLPPVSMWPRTGDPEEEFAQLVAATHGGVWVADADGDIQSFLRVDATVDGASVLVSAPGNAAVSGAYTRPGWRGRGLAPALLDAALGAHAAAGGLTMSVDYETVNPLAMSFWPSRFRTVSVAMTRILEYPGPAAHL